jgi:alkanesulfonate monooxygenase SsuD/methylene tetrahydromethanopterin reductase-like flavin-dependent oxidoreductase (luciferase family)
MELGIGLPNAVPGATKKQLTDFARAAEQAGFSTLGTIDRIVYPNYEPVLSLSAAAAVTERIRLATSVMLGPLRQNPALVAKQMLTLDSLAGGGRAVLGIGMGAREDDYEISGMDMSTRGEWLDDALERILKIWRGEGELESKVGPRPQGDGPSLIIGGYVQASFKRAARFADGWIQGGSGPDQFEQDSANLDQAWQKSGREGKPRKMALGYFSLGEQAEENAERYLLDYYAWLGDDAEGIAASAPKDADGIQAALESFESKGCDELILFPCSSEPEQVTLLADAVGLEPTGHRATAASPAAS